MPALNDHLCFKLYALSRQVTNLYRPLLEELDMTYPQYLVMLVLWEQQQLSVKELGTLLYLDSGTLTPLLKRLEKKGLLTRRRDPGDERSVIVELTKKGESLQRQAKCIPEELNKTLKLKETEYISVRSMLDNLLREIA